MIRYFTYFLLAALCSFLLPACNENEIEYNKEETPLALTLSETAITLSARTPGADALTFSWTSGTNAGTNAAIEYVLQIDRQDNDFSGGVTVDLGRRKYTHKYTNAQLNDIMLGDFNVAPGDSATLEARIIALVSSENASDQISEAIPFTVTAYMPVAATLYMIGSATAGSWDLDKATRMTPIPNEAGGFTVTTALGIGELKFVTTTNSDFLPSYNRDVSSPEPKLIYRQGESDPDDKFNITSAARYRITVNIIDLAIAIEELEPVAGPRYNKLFLVGDCTGWSFKELTQDPLNLFIFRYGAIFNSNGDRDFKFSTLANFDNATPMLHPTIADAPMTHTTATIYAGDPDYKWKLTPEQNNKAYKIAVDITEGEETMTMTEYTPYTDIYVIGEASPIGWTLNDRNQAKMNKGADDYTYIWTGILKIGEIKFKCSDDSSFDNNAAHPWYMAPDFELPVVLNTDMIMSINTRGIGDRKWIVQEAGSYTITINQLTEKIRFAK
jgi:hypothetical protein